MNSLTNLLAQLAPDDDLLKGTQFEHICKWFLENDRRYRHLTQVWLWNDWPGNWGSDAGIDLVAQDQDGRYWAIQAKAYDEKYWIKKRDVDKFLSESGRPQISYRLLIGTTDRIMHRAEKTLNEQEKPGTFVGLTKLEAAQVNWPASLSDLQPPKLPPKQPRDYQIEAVNAVVDGFEKSDRGQMIMACGTGKTLTSLFVKEKLAADRVLVLAPSLSLLSQTLIEWTANATVAFQHLPVCSDETVANDSIVMSANELGDRVTTDPEKIADFLRGSGPRTVFATYQSSPEIAKAFGLGGVAPFDLVVADEAHRTTGPCTSMFATVLDDEKIPAQRRLFMTATPRRFTGRVIHEAAALDYEVASMDDEAKYGPVFHRLAFAEAIERGRLTDYQVVVVGVDDVECRELADKARWVISDGIGIKNARPLAAQIGLAKAMSRHDLRRAISFHSRVESARRFSHSLPEVISWMPADQRPTGQVWANYVSGAMTAKQRSVRLRELGTIDTDHRGLLANARCLTEGVDVPTLDGVVFIDPKRSEVDIVQAVGRAIRLADNKTVGTIVIPVFMDTDADHEVILDDSTFKTVWDVVRALRMHDEELAEQLDSLRLGLGHRGAGQPRLPEKIHLDVPRRIGARFARAFTTRLVDSVTAPWLEWFGRLQEHLEITGTTRVLPNYKTPDGYPLGRWVAKQRALYKRDKLSAERIEMLNGLGDWSWEPRDDYWDEMFGRLREYYEANGTAGVPTDHKTPDGYPLGEWVRNQRTLYRKRELSTDRVELLKNLGDWSWGPVADKWQQWFEKLQEHFDATGTTYVSQHGNPLGVWVNTQRTLYKEGKLFADRIELLKNLGDWTWDHHAGEWEKMFGKLREYFEDTGTTRVPQRDKPLGPWVNHQRLLYKRGKLSVERIELLKNLGDWTWDQRADDWEELFDRLQKHFEDTGTTRVIKDYQTPDGYSLGQWITTQRTFYNKGKLSVERIELLKNVGDWTWELHADKWLEWFEKLREHFDATGTTRVRASGNPLGRWISRQRALYKQGKLSTDRIKKLKNLGDWTWDGRS